MMLVSEVGFDLIIPPDQGGRLDGAPNTSELLRQSHQKPKVNPWVLLLLLES